MAKEGFFKIEILEPGTVCTQSYLVANSYGSLNEAKNLLQYLKTKFLRFMLFQVLTSQDISRENFVSFLCLVQKKN